MRKNQFPRPAGSDAQRVETKVARSRANRNRRVTTGCSIPPLPLTGNRPSPMPYVGIGDDPAGLFVRQSISAVRPIRTCERAKTHGTPAPRPHRPAPDRNALPSPFYSVRPLGEYLILYVSYVLRQYQPPTANNERRFDRRG